MAEPSGPDLGVLERALSRRAGVGTAGGFDKRPSTHAFDNKQVLPHMVEDALHTDVTSSSSEAMASVLYFANSSNNSNNNNDSTKTRSQSERVVAAYAEEGAGGDAANKEEDEHEDLIEGEEGEEDGVENDGDGDVYDDLESLPPIRRRLVSMNAKSASSDDFGRSQRSLSCGESWPPPWEPNVQMKLEEFDRDSVSYLAEGAMCQCFLARKLPASMNLPEGSFEESKREGVIIKTPTDGGPETSENDLVVESLVLRKLSHRHIVSFLGAGSTPKGTSFIVLEYLSMGTLRERLDKCGGGLGVNPAIKYGKQLASALAYMHDDALPGRILMHRDLKPDNIGYSSDGEAKLMDFGLAKVINRTVRCGSVKYEMTGETGSPRYMPPEVAKSQPYNEKADVWSFIIMLWEMAAGQLPFAGMNMESFLVQVCDGGKRPPLQNQWPADIKSLLRSGWQADPDKRPSFREIHAVLTGVEREVNSKKKGVFGRW